MKSPSYRVKQAIVRAFSAGLMAAISYGSWAYWVNFSSVHASTSAILQALMSFIITLSLSSLLESACYRPASFIRWLNGLMILSILFTTMALLHRWLGTKSILITLMPSYIIASLYSFTYIRWINKEVL